MEAGESPEPSSPVALNVGPPAGQWVHETREHLIAGDRSSGLQTGGDDTVDTTAGLSPVTRKVKAANRCGVWQSPSSDLLG